MLIEIFISPIVHLSQKLGLAGDRPLDHSALEDHEMDTTLQNLLRRFNKANTGYLTNHRERRTNRQRRSQWPQELAKEAL